MTLTKSCVAARQTNYIRAWGTQAPCTRDTIQAPHIVGSEEAGFLQPHVEGLGCRVRSEALLQLLEQQRVSFAADVGDAGVDHHLLCESRVVWVTNMHQLHHFHAVGRQQPSSLVLDPITCHGYWSHAQNEMPAKSTCAGAHGSGHHCWGLP